MALPEIKVKIGADTSDLDKGLAAATKNLGKFAAAAGVGIAGAAVAAATGLAVLTKRAIDNADALDNMSQRLGVSIEALSRLQYAAKLSDTSIESLQTGFRTLANNMVGGADAFAQLGINVANADGSMRSSVDVFSDVADRFASMEDGALKSSIAVDLFGRSGLDLIPMLNEGSAGLAEFGRQSDAVSYTLTTKTARAAAAFNNTVDEINLSLDGVVNKIMEAALPALQGLADIIASPEFATAAATLATNVINGLNAILSVIAKVTNALNELFSGPQLGQSEQDLRRQIENSYRILNENQPGTAGYNKVMEQLGREELALQRLVSLRKNLRDPIGDGASFDELSGFTTQTGETYKPPNLPTLTGGGDGTSELDAERERIAARLAVIQEGFLTEAEMRDAKYADDQAALKDALMNGMYPLEADYRKDVEALEKEHQDQLAAIRNAALYQNLDATASIFGSISSIMKTQGDKQIALQKGIASAGVAISTAAGIMKAIEQFGWPGGLLPAAAVAAQGMAQLASINSASASGANSAGVKGSSNASTAEPAMNRTLTVQGITAGQIFTGDSMRDFMEQMLQMQRDGYQVVLA
jgi:hypothetical protein